MRDPNKLASFPLDAYKDAPDNQQIFGTGTWSLTVGDVRVAVAAARWWAGVDADFPIEETK